ncbi:MAG: carbohydrate ABC transporter permease [Firmicutes bacterium]|nr:carbohydrate ABC transporter permease [Bacillota bacterium]
MVKQTISTAEQARQLKKRRQRIDAIKKILVFIILSLGALLYIAPLLWMVSTSIKTDIQTFADPPIWIPSPAVWDNYIKIITSSDWQRWAWNTIYLTAMGLIGTLLSTSLVAFSFARLQWPGRNFWFVVLLSTMMLPYQVTMVPMYLIFTRLGWVNTFKPLTVPPFFAVGGAFYIFLLRQFFLTIPRELDEAAIIDGCSTFRIFWEIILPLAKPALATVAIFTFMAHWNAFLSPLIYIRDSKLFTLTLGLASLRTNYAVSGIVMWNQLMAASILIALPCLLLFFFAQRYFIQGVVMSGIKG